MAREWLSARDGARLLELLPHLSPAGEALAKRRLLPPWLQRQDREQCRDKALFALAGTFDAISGRQIADQIAADLDRPRRSVPPSRRAFVAEVLRYSKPLGADRVRSILAGVAQNQDQKKATRGETIATVAADEAIDGVEPGSRKKAHIAGG
jgi:hypothetical protein